MLLGLRCIWLLHFVPFGKALRLAVRPAGKDSLSIERAVYNQYGKKGICENTQFCPQDRERQQSMLPWNGQIVYFFIQNC